MTEASAERVLQGIAAADGLVIGGLVLDLARAAGDAAAVAEDVPFEAAIDQARGELKSLIAGSDELAGEILEFQEALLEDDDLLDPVKQAIAGGKAPAEAWSAHLDGEIEIYRSGEDAYLAARAEDLLDLKQRVLRALTGGSARQ